jgi:hypothetical protein
MIQNMKGTLSEDELETLRKRAWREQGILIVSPYDDRLQFFDRTRLCEIGNRFYGQNLSKNKT